jgi:hypothetical protein
MQVWRVTNAHDQKGFGKQPRQARINNCLCLPGSNASKLKIINCMAAELKGLTGGFNPPI